MGLFSKFEGKMEDTLEGVADRMVNSPISPVQIAKKAEKKMLREKMVGAGKQYAPTLYTVLVNPDDDERLFGYYPTLAGETETFLSARAAEEGFVMDGQPLVRFIVDEELHHGKFDIIAEAVAAPLIAQLREEEMRRYGLGSNATRMTAGQGYAEDAGYESGTGYAAGADYAGGANYAVSQGSVAGADYASPNYEDIADYADADFVVDADYPRGMDAGAGYATEMGANADFLNEGIDFEEEASKPPLPYVPEDELDYSIDYGEYTFDSQDFEDYRKNGSAGAPVPGSVYDPQTQPDYNAAYDASSAHDANAAYAAPNTVVFAAGAGAATPQPNNNVVRARLIDTTNQRTYALATVRLLIGRESSCNISLPDINASRTHAELRFEPQGVWTITDLGSTNGTFVNGHEISTCVLRRGDSITIGMTSLVFELA